MLLMLRRMAISATCVASVACSSSSSPSNPLDASTAGDTTTDAETVSCANEPGLDTYVANLTKTGKGGTTFVLVASDPAPPQRGMNKLTLRVADAKGNALAGALIYVKPFMPQHGHGSSQTPVVTDSGGGNYSIGNLYLFMPGLWTITITSHTGDPDAGGSSDSAVFTFCIAG